MPTKALPIPSLNLSIILWSLSQNFTLEQISMLQIESCAKQQIDDLSDKRASAQIRIEQHSYFRWRHSKA